MVDNARKGIIGKTDSGEIVLKLSEQFYEKSAVLNAAYKFADKCFIRIEPLEEGYVGILFKAKEGQNPQMVQNILDDFCNEALDQQVRLDLEKRYGGLRESIIKHAFLPIEGLPKDQK